MGGIGSIGGAIIQANAAKDAAKQALTGYNYLNSGGGAGITSGAVNYGSQAQDIIAQFLGLKPANANGTTAPGTVAPTGAVTPGNPAATGSGGHGHSPIGVPVQGTNFGGIAGGPTGGPAAAPVPATGGPAAAPVPATGGPAAAPVPATGGPAAAPVPASGAPAWPTQITPNAGLNNYLNSTGYQFAFDQGDKAITGNAAARGILNSGATAKALTEYGQQTAQSGVTNYLNSLSALVNGGQNAATTVANAGTNAGSNAAQYVGAGGNAISNGFTGALGGFGGALSNYLNRPQAA